MNLRYVFLKRTILIMVCLFVMPAFAAQVYAEGRWLTQSESGCKVWTHNSGPSAVFTWTGACKNGFVDGSGILQWSEAGASGDKYIGQYVLGRENGKGTFTWTSTHASYEGDFINGSRSGKGIQHFADGNRYEGAWSNDMPNGKGVESWAKGARYEGDFVNGQMHGNGAITLVSGRVFSGRWENSSYLGP